MFSTEAQGDEKWRDVCIVLILAGFKLYMGGGVMSRGWNDWVAENDHGVCASFPLFYYPVRQKLEMAMVSEDESES